MNSLQILLYSVIDKQIRTINQKYEKIKKMKFHR